MRVAVVHSFYRSGMPSGENEVVRTQLALLSAAGLSVSLVARDSDRVARNWWAPARLALTTASGWGGDPTEELRALNPDILHLHNLFPNFGTRWLARWQGPVVVTVHNYRPLCVNGLLLRDGQLCVECFTGGPAQGVRHGCYRDSRIASVPLALANLGGPAANPVLRRAGAVVFPSQTQRDIYVEAGLPATKSHVIPNGLPDRPPSYTHRAGWLFVGRLSPEKGLSGLLDCWPEGEQLTVFGSGPLESQLRARSDKRVRWNVGSREDVAKAMPDAEGLVFPSLAIEVQPTVVVEALRAGTPVVARRGTSAAALVESMGVGAVYDASQVSLAAALQHCRDHGPRLRKVAREAYEEHFTDQRWLAATEALYMHLS